MSDVKLAYNPGPVDAYPGIRLATNAQVSGRKGATPDPKVLLAVSPKSATGGSNSAQHHVESFSPAVKLAYGNSPPERNGTSGLEVDRLTLPALLVSYVYLKPFLKRQKDYRYRDWALDSGAFSAHMSGTEISLQAYIDTCLKLKSNDPTLAEVFSLDVIGDHEASLRNCEEMWRQGVEAIPCYHIGSPEEALTHIAKHYPKIAIGGVARARKQQKLEFAGQVFSRVWPKRIHGFGFGDETSIMSLPFHSVDATSWEMGPCAFGVWKSYKGGKVSVRGSSQDLRVEVEWYMRLETRARRKWKKEMEVLAAL